MNKIYMAGSVGRSDSDMTFFSSEEIAKRYYIHKCIKKGRGVPKEHEVVVISYILDEKKISHDFLRKEIASLNKNNTIIEITESLKDLGADYNDIYKAIKSLNLDKIDSLGNKEQ